MFFLKFNRNTNNTWISAKVLIKWLNTRKFNKTRIETNVCFLKSKFSLISIKCYNFGTKTYFNVFLYISRLDTNRKVWKINFSCSQPDFIRRKHIKNIYFKFTAFSLKKMKFIRHIYLEKSYFRWNSLFQMRRCNRV